MDRLQHAAPNSRDLLVQLAQRGANLGSACIALALNWRAPPMARRVPLGNVVIKLAGVLLALALLPWLQPYLALISDEPGHLIANFHTLFNLVLALAFLWLPVAFPANELAGRHVLHGGLEGIDSLQRQHEFVRALRVG